MADIVMAHIVMACIVMAYVVMAYIAMAHIVLANIVMAHIVMAHIAMTLLFGARLIPCRIPCAVVRPVPTVAGHVIVMAHIVMPHTVMAYIVMAKIPCAVVRPVPTVAGHVYGHACRARAGGAPRADDRTLAGGRAGLHERAPATRRPGKLDPGSRGDGLFLERKESIFGTCTSSVSFCDRSGSATSFRTRH